MELRAIPRSRVEFRHSTTQDRRAGHGNDDNHTRRCLPETPMEQYRTIRQNDHISEQRVIIHQQREEELRAGDH